MLELILDKLGFDTIEAFLDNMNATLQQDNGYEVERKNPFLVLNKEERDFLQQYVNTNGLA